MVALLRHTHHFSTVTRKSNFTQICYIIKHLVLLFRMHGMSYWMPSSLSHCFLSPAPSNRNVFSPSLSFFQCLARCFASLQLFSQSPIEFLFILGIAVKSSMECSLVAVLSNILPFRWSFVEEQFWIDIYFMPSDFSYPTHRAHIIHA